MAHSDAREGKWRGNWRMEWVASTLHTTSEHGVSSITTADAQHTSAAISRLNWRPPGDLNGLVRLARKTKYGFWACAIAFQLTSVIDTMRLCGLAACVWRNLAEDDFMVSKQIERSLITSCRCRLLVHILCFAEH